MINKNIGRLRLEIYGGIDELPADRYNKFNIYCLLSAGIGNDAESVLDHMSGIYQSLGKKDYERALVQLQNYHHSLSMILEGEDMQSTAFACLVKSINGKEITDLSEEGLAWIVKRITRAENRQKVLAIFNILKKKLRLRSRSISQRE